MIRIINLIADPRYFWMHPYVVTDRVCANNNVADSFKNDYVEAVTEIKVTFMNAHPYLSGNDIPMEMITPGGDIVDSHISVEAAKAQIQRIASIRGVEKESLTRLIYENKNQSLEYKDSIDVLRLNIKLNEI